MIGYDKNEFTKQKQILLLAAAVGIIGAFLPWASVSVMGISQSVNGLSGDGIITLVLFAVAGYLSFKGDKKEVLSGNSLYIIVGAFGIAGLIGLYDINQMGQVTGLAAIGASASIGIGLYLTLLAGAAGAILPFVIKEK